MEYKKALIATLVAGILMGTPVFAATESVYTMLYFDVSENLLMTVAIYSGSDYSNTAASATGAGTLHSSGIAFNSTSGTDTWINASDAIGGSAQNDTYGIIKVTNDGNVDFWWNVSTATAPSSLDACLAMACSPGYQYDDNSQGLPTNSFDINATTAWVVNATGAKLAVGNDVTIWCYGNFSSCTTGVQSTYLYINASSA